MGAVVRGVLLIGSFIHMSCSVLGVRGPPKPCTDSYVWPGLDTAVALLGVAAAVASSSSSDGDANGGDALTGIVVIAAVPAALSAFVGYAKVSACRDETDEDDEDEEGGAERTTGTSRTPHVSGDKAPQDSFVTARKRAWVLHEEALRSDNCAVVRDRAAKIRAIDIDFYRHRFLPHQRVRACAVSVPDDEPAPTAVDDAEPSMR